MSQSQQATTTARPKPIVAYQVNDDYEGHSEIVFHSHAIAARRIGANCLNTEFDAVSCRRAPWADEYAGAGAVPVSACIAQGWRFEECCGFGNSLSEDGARRLLAVMDGVTEHPTNDSDQDPICRTENAPLSTRSPKAAALTTTHLHPPRR